MMDIINKYSLMLFLKSDLKKLEHETRCRGPQTFYRMLGDVPVTLDGVTSNGESSGRFDGFVVRIKVGPKTNIVHALPSEPSFSKLKNVCEDILRTKPWGFRW